MTRIWSCIVYSVSLLVLATCQGKFSFIDNYFFSDRLFTFSWRVLCTAVLGRTYPHICTCRLLQKNVQGQDDY